MAPRSRTKVVKRTRDSSASPQSDRKRTLTRKARVEILASQLAAEHMADRPTDIRTMENFGEGGPAMETPEPDLANPGHDEVALEGRTDSDSRCRSHPAALDPSEGKEQGSDEGEQKHFRLMELPAEIRQEIYRACLTRPWKIVLSKEAKAREDVKNETVDNADDADYVDFDEPMITDTNYAHRADRHQQVLVEGSLAPRRHSSISVPSPRLLPMPMQPGWQRSTSGSSASASRRHANHAGSSRQPARPTVAAVAPTKQMIAAREPRPEALIVNILRTSKEVYKEARDVLYSENTFQLKLPTAVASLEALHQRSRRHIRHVEVEIPTYSDILERFSEVVRLSLRYCSGLKRLSIHMNFLLPGTVDTSGISVMSSSTAAASSPSSSSSSSPINNANAVYANGFDILRWLPQQCDIVLFGTPNAEIERVVRRHLELAKSQDKLAYARRQLISHEA